MPLHIATPLIESVSLAAISGREIWLKMEALQPSGSFKLRGVGAACEHHARQDKRAFISSSGGNAGIAVAYAGRQLSVPVTVFVPKTTSETAKTLIRLQGANVVTHGESWQEANALALSKCDDRTAFIHPFDDPLLWTGHATMIDEVVREGKTFDAVVLSVGGGGLLCGVAEGLARNNLLDIPIIAVETRGAESLSRSVAAGSLVELPAITSVATSLGARKISAKALELTRTRPIKNIVVTDRSAVSACNRFLDDHRVLVEPACGAALAIVYEGAEVLADYRKVLVIVCGGATASCEQLRAWEAKGV